MLHPKTDQYNISNIHRDPRIGLDELRRRDDAIVGEDLERGGWRLRKLGGAT
jgi:hypothetical protein